MCSSISFSTENLKLKGASKVTIQSFHFSNFITNVNLLGILLKCRFLIQEVWVGAWDSAFPKSFFEPHFEYQGSSLLFTPPSVLQKSMVMGRDTEFPKATQLLSGKGVVLQFSIFYMEPEFSCLVLLWKAMKIMILCIIPLHTHILNTQYNMTVLNQVAYFNRF